MAFRFSSLACHSSVVSLGDSLGGCAQFGVASHIIKHDGIGGLYKGLSAGLLRQATYTTARLGIFNSISDYLKEANQGKVGALPQAHPIPSHPFLSALPAPMHIGLCMHLPTSISSSPLSCPHA